MAFAVDLRAVGAGYYRVMVNGVETSRHLQEREAAEAAIEQKVAAPTAVVWYVHDYRVLVDYTAPVTPPSSGLPVSMGLFGELI